MALMCSCLRDLLPICLFTIRSKRRNGGGLQGKLITRSNKVAWRVFDNQGVVLDTTASRIFGINQSGARLWELLQKPITYDDLVSTFALEFDRTPEEIQADVAEFIDDLHKRGLVEIS